MTDTLLLNDFYAVSDKVKTGDLSFSCRIRFNAEHAVFRGHFEQMPVVPGVCQVQLIMELLQEELGMNLRLQKGDNIKFTGMIVPTQHPEVLAELSYRKEGEIITADAKIYHENITFTKFKGSFKQA